MKYKKKHNTDNNKLQSSDLEKGDVTFGHSGNLVLVLPGKSGTAKGMFRAVHYSQWEGLRIYPADAISYYKKFFSKQ